MNKTFLGSMALAASLLAAPVVLAAPNSTQGDTSGPASGTVTTPSAAVQKQAANPDGTAAGAPGVSGKSGGESGPQPKGPPGQNQPAKH